MPNDCYDLNRIRKKLKKKLNHHRYQHTLGVAYTAGCLAMRYGIDVNLAMTAGLLHDCAKYLTTEQLLALCREYEITLSAVEEANPQLLHAKAGVVIAIRDYDMKDPAILSAIQNHTTGAPAMPLLDQIIFTADYIEPNREVLPNIDEIRRLAFTDLEASIIEILKATLDYLKYMNTEIDETTRHTFDFYVCKKEEEKNGKNQNR